MAQYSFKKEDLDSANQKGPIDEIAEARLQARRSIYKGEPVSEDVKKILFPKEYEEKEQKKKESEEYLKKHMEIFRRKEEAMRKRKKELREKGIEEGPRGGLYTNDVTKDGRPYRRYF